jgi:hypothetical protein
MDLSFELDRGEGRRHLLVGVVLQASQVEVGISREKTGNNAVSIRESQTGSGSERKIGVRYGIRDIRTGERRTSSTKLTEQYNVI